MAKVSGGWALTGIRGFEAALEKAGADITAKAADACQVTAFAVAQRAKAGVPVDQGDLKKFIAAQGRGLNWRVGILGGPAPGRHGSPSHTHPSVYGVWYEYGFKTKHIDTYSYMRTSRDAEATPHRNRLADAINGALTSAASASSRHL